MPNLTITDIDNGSSVFSDAITNKETLVIPGAQTIKPGTILARDSTSLKLVLFVKGGVTNENGIPKAILTYEIVAAAGADFAVDAMVGGNARKENLVIDADGDASNIDEKVLDQLRDFAIISIESANLSVLDNS